MFPFDWRYWLIPPAGIFPHWYAMLSFLALGVVLLQIARKHSLGEGARGRVIVALRIWRVAAVCGILPYLIWMFVTF